MYVILQSLSPVWFVRIFLLPWQPCQYLTIVKYVGCMKLYYINCLLFYSEIQHEMVKQQDLEYDWSI